MDPPASFVAAFDFRQIGEADPDPPSCISDIVAAPSSPLRPRARSRRPLEPPCSNSGERSRKDREPPCATHIPSVSLVSFQSMSECISPVDSPSTSTSPRSESYCRTQERESPRATHTPCVKSVSLQSIPTYSATANKTLETLPPTNTRPQSQGKTSLVEQKLSRLNVESRRPVDLDEMSVVTTDTNTILGYASSVVTAIAVKESSEENLGLGLEYIGGRTIVTGVASDGLFRKSEKLKVGMALKSINSIECSSLAKRDIIKLLETAVGRVVIMAEDIGFVSASVTGMKHVFELGLTFVERQGKVFLSDVSDHGLFAQSALKIGMQLMMINKMPCEGLSLPEITFLFQQAGRDVQVMAQEVGNVAVSVTRNAPGKLGLGLVERDGELYISEIYTIGLFANTKLKSGMRILAINKQPTAGLSLPDAVRLFQQARKISILAQDPGYIHVSVNRPSKSIKCAIGLSEINGNIFVARIAPGSLFSGTALRVGHKLVRVNNTEMWGLSIMDAKKIFKNATGTVKIVAEPQPGIYNVAAVKPSPDCKLGITMGPGTDGFTYVNSIAKGSLFATTKLKPGYKILSVNGTNCVGLPLCEVVQLFLQATHDLNILAENPGESTFEFGAGAHGMIQEAIPTGMIQEAIPQPPPEQQEQRPLKSLWSSRRRVGGGNGGFKGFGSSPSSKRHGKLQQPKSKAAVLARLRCKGPEDDTSSTFIF